jgi:lytic murein transglycosylase
VTLLKSQFAFPKRNSPPSVPPGHLPHKGGDWLIFKSRRRFSISPLVGEMPGRAEGGKSLGQLLTALLLTLLLTTPAAALDKSAVTAEFRSWLKTDLWPKAEKAGITRKTFDSAFSDVELMWNLPDLVPPGTKPPKKREQSQAEFSSPGPYFSEKRLQALAAGGQAMMRSHAATLKKIEQVYGVPGRIVLAVWGRETGYGRASIPNRAIDVLATKAFMSTRRQMFEGELISALHIIGGGDSTVDGLKGSWAGALGQPQFMPTSYLQYAVDFDGDGKRNIWTSVPDTLASIANYLSKKGWQRGRDWGYEVTIPAKVSCAQEGPDLAKPIGQWAVTGIARITGKDFPAEEKSKPGMMLVPAGRDGPAFIVTPNFYVIKEYNNSDLYALFIGNLADRIAYNSGPFRAPWGDIGHMLRSDVAAMQRALEKQGYDVGGADGLPGYKTRRSLGAWQQKNGMAATCFPEERLKGKVR